MRVTVAVPDWAQQLASDDTDMERAPVPLEPSETPTVDFEVPDDGYFEYGFVDAQGKLRADPSNGVKADNPWYPSASALSGPDYRPDPFSTPDRELERGQRDRLRLTSAALGGQLRRVNVYTPRGHEGAPLPLVVVQDGVAFDRLAGIHLVGEALVARGEARPARYAFVEPVDRREEYGYSDAYLEFLLAELLPAVEAVGPGTGENVWLGASLGGLASANAALARPDLAASVVTFSGAFLGEPEHKEYYATRNSRLLERLRDRQTELPARWYLEVGTIEWLTDINRSVHAALEARGVETAMVERHAGHNWTNWRNGMAPALRFALKP
ncbi:MAG TPA: alpha/beta hydrolase-fold protein [Trueperaceae bacterium]|nr:alpha/beta hydrolase-fold protein [Trueperaceae bacterium]